MPVLYVGQCDRAVQSFDVHVSAGDVADLDGGAGTLQSYISIKPFGAQRTRAGVEGDAGGGGHQDLVIHASGLRVGTRQQVRLDLDAIADQIVIDFNFIGIEQGIDYSMFTSGRFYEFATFGSFDR